MSERRILVVEDDATLRETIAYNLEHQGYQVLSASDGSQAMDIARQSAPDLVLLDVMLPGLDGFEVCRLLRQESNVPVIMLTARTDEVDKIVGLEVGADDYITKPFSNRELMARIKAVFRRVRLVRDDLVAERTKNDPDALVKPFQSLDVGDLFIDTDRREILLNGEPLMLKPKEYELLYFLARHRGSVLSRDLILERVWGWEFSGGSRTVDVHVRWLREKIEADSSVPTRIVTVRGVGYRFEG